MGDLTLEEITAARDRLDQLGWLLTFARQYIVTQGHPDIEETTRRSVEVFLRETEALSWGAGEPKLVAAFAMAQQYLRLRARMEKASQEHACRIPCEHRSCIELLGRRDFVRALLAEEED